jgi:hypothetical protein
MTIDGNFRTRLFFSRHALTRTSSMSRDYRVVAVRSSRMFHEAELVLRIAQQ